MRQVMRVGKVNPRPQRSTQVSQSLINNWRGEQRLLAPVGGGGAGGMGRGGDGAHVEHILVLVVSLSSCLHFKEGSHTAHTHSLTICEREVLGPASRDLSQVEGWDRRFIILARSQKWISHTTFKICLCECGIFVCAWTEGSSLTLLPRQCCAHTHARPGEKERLPFYLLICISITEQFPFTW